MDNQEFNIWKTGKAQGKDDAFIKGAILEYRRQKNQTSELVTAEPQRGLYVPGISEVGQFGTEFGTGVTKGGISTFKGLSDLGEKIASQTVGRVVNLVQGKGFTPLVRPSPFETAVGGADVVQKLTEPTTPTESAGKLAEQIAEFFIPSGAATKAERYLDVLTKGYKPLTGALTRVAGKAGVQGLAAGTVRAAQTGGDIKETLTTAGLAGGIRGGLAAGGEALRAFKIPTRLYNVIFKNTRDDMAKELNAEALKNWQVKYPAEFNSMVEKGLVKLKDGNPVLNNTLAEQALDKGLKGSFKNIATEVVRGTVKAEDDVQRILSNYKGTVNISEKQYVNVLKEIAKSYKNVGFGEVSAQADDLASRLVIAKGKVDGLTALELRRFLDRMRLASSFDKPAISLSQTQSNFKTLADTVRSRLAGIEVGGKAVGPVMKDYGFYIDAMEAISREAAKRGNAQVLGMIDSLFLGGAAIATNPVAPLTAGVLRKVLQAPGALTNLAQLIQRGGISPATGGLLGATSAGIANTAVKPQ